MRTTLDIDEDVLMAAKEIAAKGSSTAGAVLSELARKGLSRPQSFEKKVRNGVPVFSSTGRVVTMEQVHRLMDEEGV